MAGKTIILGTGGNCVDILDTILDLQDAGGETEYDCAGFLDDNPETWGREIYGKPVLGPLKDWSHFPDCSFVNGIGSTRNFWKKLDILAGTGIPLDRFVSIIHPSASVSRMATLGRDVVILQHVTVASNARIGNHVIVLPNTIISHDSALADGVTIAGGVCISGFVEIGECCYLGTNSAITNNCRIGEKSLIGMGSVVLHDVSPHSVMVGNPARLLRQADFV